jgi:cysteine desulfurase
VIEDLPANNSAYCHDPASHIELIIARMSANHQHVIYLDNNATTQVDPAVFEAIVPWLREEFGNPSSVYSLGKRAAAAVHTAREQVASLAGCAPEEIIFTSCGSESINSAILSAASIDPDKTHIVTTAVEHSATIKLCEHLARRGYEITWLPVDNLGRLDLEKLERAIRPDTALVTLLWANNETGTLFPVHEIARITNRKKVALHVDAVQAVGKLPLSIRDLGIQFLSLSGHKLHSPKGAGALYISSRVRFTPWLRGSQENGRRGGTQNVASIVGLGKAAELAAGHLEQDSRKAGTMRDRFEEAILKAVPGTEINGDRSNRLPNTTNIAFEGIESEGALMLLDERGICCSAGSACTSGSVHPSHVLKAMGFSNHRARSSLRFSFGRFNTDEQVAFACAAVPEVIEKLRRLSPARGPVVMAA